MEDEVQHSDILFQTYSKGSDGEWETDLLASITNPRHRELEWPTVPSASVQQGLQGSDGVVSVREALAFRSFVKSSSGARLGFLARVHIA
jgi:hypothetical protein